MPYQQCRSIFRFYCRTQGRFGPIQADRLGEDANAANHLAAI